MADRNDRSNGNISSAQHTDYNSLTQSSSQVSRERSAPSNVPSENSSAARSGGAWESDTHSGEAPARAGRPPQGANLTQEHRIRGGQNSAQAQTRDSHGQFAGRQSASRPALNNSTGVGRDTDTTDQSARAEGTHARGDDRAGR